MRFSKIYNCLVVIITSRYIISYLRQSQALFRVCFKVLLLTEGFQSSMIFGIEVPSLKIKAMPEKIFIVNI
jgi:hypothetical protein